MTIALPSITSARQSPSMWAEFIATYRRPDLSAIPADQLEQVLQSLCEQNSVTDHFVEYLLRSSSEPVRNLTFNGAYNLRKATLNLIPQYAQEIVSLDLSKCRQIENKLIQNIFERCSYLEHLTLDGCVKLSDSAFNCLRFLPLRSLSLAGLTQISPVSLNRLLLVLDRLETVNLSHCKTAVDACVLWSIFDAAQTDRLRHVNITNTAVLGSDFAFLQYPGLTVPLVTLTMAGTQGSPAKFTDLAVEVVARLCGPTLAEVSFAWNSAVGDKGVTVMAKAGRGRLLRLNLGNTGVTSEGVAVVVDHCENLENLNLDWCTAVDGRGLRRVVEELKYLTELEVSNITDFLRDDQFQGVHPDFARNLHLKVGNFAGTPDLTASQVFVKTMARMENLQFLAMNVSRGSEYALTTSLSDSACFRSLKELCLDLSLTSGRLLRLEALMHGTETLIGLEKLQIFASNKNQVNDALLTSLFNGSRKSLRHVELNNCAEVSDDLFPSWLSFDPEKEAIEYVDFLIDRRLLLPRRTAGVSSDSDATVLHRPSRNLGRLRGKSFGLGTTSGSEAESSGIPTQSRPRPPLTAQGQAVQRLTVLSLSGATSLTDKSVLALSRLLPWVQTLELRECRVVNEDTLENLRRNCRCLRRLTISTPQLRVRLDTGRSFTRRTRRTQSQDSNEEE